MIYEDDGAERLVLDGEFDIAIPFSITCDGGEPRIGVFPSQRSGAEEFLRLFGDSEDNIFSERAIGWARRRFEPFLNENGFVLCEDNDDYFLEYRITNPDSRFILDGTLRLDGPITLENLTGYDFDAMIQNGHICYATVADGRIVSAACTNYSCALTADEGDEREIEIGVETAPEYRNRGYGLSCAAALSSGLAARGYAVLYECESRNAASIALVNRLGGELFARNFCVVGARIAED